MDAILFTGGASGISELDTIDVSRLSKGISFARKDRGERSFVTNPANYSEKVLVGNWFERRSEDHPQRAEWTTVYKTHYKPHGRRDFLEEAFKVWKIERKTRGADRQPLIDGKIYLDNMTSAYDLTYRILPKDLCGPRIRVYNARKNVWVPEADLTRSYGNQTKYGLAESVKAKQTAHIREAAISPWNSIYTIDYNEPKIADDDTSVKRHHHFNHF